jgi:hypothetical protein
LAARQVRVQIGAESKVMHKLQQHAAKMSEQLEFVKGSIVAAADIRSHLDRYLDNLHAKKADLKANEKKNLKSHCPGLFIHIYTN